MRDYWCTCMICKQKDKQGQGLWVHKATYYRHQKTETSSSGSDTSSPEEYKHVDKDNINDFFESRDEGTLISRFLNELPADFPADCTADYTDIYKNDSSQENWDKDIDCDTDVYKNNTSQENTDEDTDHDTGDYKNEENWDEDILTSTVYADNSDDESFERDSSTSDNDNFDSESTCEGISY